MRLYSSILCWTNWRLSRGLAAAFGFANGAPSERWLVLVHRRLVDNWETLQSVLPWNVCKPSRILDMHSDRSGLIARLKKLKAYGLESVVERIFPRAGKGPEQYDRLPIVLALLASYDPDVKGLVNMTALVDALREDSSLRELCGVYRPGAQPHDIYPDSRSHGTGWELAWELGTIGGDQAPGNQ